LGLVGGQVAYLVLKGLCQVLVGVGIGLGTRVRQAGAFFACGFKAWGRGPDRCLVLYPRGGDACTSNKRRGSPQALLCPLVTHTTPLFQRTGSAVRCARWSFGMWALCSASCSGNAHAQRPRSPAGPVFPYLRLFWGSAVLDGVGSYCSKDFIDGWLRRDGVLYSVVS
jgi:hypothetical protein